VCRKGSTSLESRGRFRSAIDIRSEPLGKARESARSLLNEKAASSYISQETDGKEDVIDGQQRLTVFFIHGWCSNRYGKTTLQLIACAHFSVNR
jgi:hypothetical protein